ncbi:MAG TPA: energy transducer TonB [Polyangiaceae bacterium]|nr:energy transducer TonB [Polyangiaceae bacterium]
MKNRGWIAYVLALGLHALLLFGAEPRAVKSPPQQKREYLDVTLAARGAPEMPRPVPAPAPPVPPQQATPPPAPRPRVQRSRSEPTPPDSTPSAAAAEPPLATPAPSQPAPPAPASGPPSTTPVAFVPVAAPPKQYLSVRQPTYATSVEPAYPLVARRRHEEGVVTVRLFINELGSLDKLELAKSSGFPLLDDAALAALRQCRFVPAYRANVPVPSRAEVEVRFQLQR